MKPFIYLLLLVLTLCPLHEPKNLPTVVVPMLLAPISLVLTLLERCLDQTLFGFTNWIPFS